MDYKNFSPFRIILDKNLIIKKYKNNKFKKIKTYVFHNVKNIKKTKLQYKDIKFIYTITDKIIN